MTIPTETSKAIEEAATAFAETEFMGTATPATGMLHAFETGCERGFKRGITWYSAYVLERLRVKQIHFGETEDRFDTQAVTWSDIERILGE